MIISAVFLVFVNCSVRDYKTKKCNRKSVCVTKSSEHTVATFTSEDVQNSIINTYHINEILAPRCSKAPLRTNIFLPC